MNQNTIWTNSGTFRMISTKTVANLLSSQLVESRDTPRITPSNVAASIPEKVTRSMFTTPVDSASRPESGSVKIPSAS